MSSEHLPCGYCDLTFSDHTGLTLHIETTHQSAATDNGFYFQCQPCSKDFHTLSELRQHIDSIHRDKEEEDKRWKCVKCDKSFPYKTRLTQHEQVHLDPTERSRPHPCADCGKKFLRSGDLWAHRRIHAGKTYSCRLCQSKLSSSGAFHNHMKAKHGGGDNMFKCETCGREFGLKQKYLVHVMLHKGKKPYECVECGRGFVHKQSLEAHVRRQHRKDSKLECKLCRKQFADAGYLSRHLKWHGRVQMAKKSS